MDASGAGTVLVTGGLGCIGAWTVRSLVDAGNSVVVLDPSGDRRRLRNAVGDDVADSIAVARADVADSSAVHETVSAHGVDRIVHLAALQVPACRADPALGAMVNVQGTVNVFEAARRAGVSTVVYTSSMAVFDLPGGRVGAAEVTRPASHYGVYKLAAEGLARVYWAEHGIAGIGIRPMTVYGPGRDTGLTSAPTRAILAATLGCRYTIGFGGATLFHFAPDVGRAIAAAVDIRPEGAPIMNLNGVHASIAEFTTAIGVALGPGDMSIDHGTEPLPFPDDADTTGLDIIGPPPITPLIDGVEATVRFFRDLDARGILVPEEHGVITRDGLAVDREVG